MTHIKPTQVPLGLRYGGLFLFYLFACAGPLSNTPVPEDLPDRVLFRTATENFNRQWYVALRDGRIWIKANSESSDYSGDWQLLGDTGLPQGCGVSQLPEHIVELSSDGTHLMVIDDKGRFHRGVNMMQDMRSWAEWHDSWGWPAAYGDGMQIDFSTARGWSVSDSHPLDVDYYEDKLGTQHSVGLGVAHIYRLSPDGRRIYFNDWWLPNDWSRQICGPERGSLEALNISVSASTLFVVGAQGQLYTRMYDFDISGESDLLTYSYTMEQPQDTTRALPLPDWRRHRDVPGLMTSRIAIYQTGKGNAARMLRVEGKQADRSGFFYKGLEEDNWNFEATDHDIDHAFIERGSLSDANSPSDGNSPSTGPEDRLLSGELRRQNTTAQVRIEIADFNLFCSPASVLFYVDDKPVTVAGQPLLLALHHVHAMQTQSRPMDYWQRGTDADIRASLLIDEVVAHVDDVKAQDVLTALFAERRVIHFAGKANQTHVDLEEIPFTTPFLFPQAEKGVPFMLYQLSAHQ